MIKILHKVARWFLFCFVIVTGMEKCSNLSMIVASKQARLTDSGIALDSYSIFDVFPKI